MVVENVPNKVREDGNGVKTDFTFGFKIYKTSDIKVYKVVKSTGVATLKTLDVDYTVAINTATDGGVVTYTTAPTALQESFLISDFDVDQQTDIPDRGGLRESQIENALDRAVLLIRQMSEKLARAVKFTITSSQTEIEMPEPEATKIPGWNATGDGMVNYDNPVVAQEAAEAAQAAAEAAQTSAEAARDLALAAQTAAELAQSLAEAAAALLGAQTKTIAIAAGELDTNAADAVIFDVAVDASFTLKKPTNGANGMRRTWRFTQDGTGGHVLTLSDDFLIASELGTAIVLSTAAGAIDELGATYHSATGKWRIEAFATAFAVPA